MRSARECAWLLRTMIWSLSHQLVPSKERKLIMSRLSPRHSLGWSGIFVVGVMAVLLSLALTPGLASAHAKLASSDPADGATVPTGVTRITLTFSEEVSVDQSTAQLLDNSGTAVAGATSAVDK